MNGAELLWPDIPASNGIIHAIDTVMLPPDVPLPEETAVVEETGNTTNATG